MKKYFLIFTTCMLVLFNINVRADTYVEAEIHSQQLRLSKDGTGIAKFIQCANDKCENVLVSITPATKGVLNGVEMDLLQAKASSRPGFVGMVYERDSKKVVTIGFSK